MSKFRRILGLTAWLLGSFCLGLLCGYFADFLTHLFPHLPSSSDSQEFVAQNLSDYSSPTECNRPSPDQPSTLKPMTPEPLFPNRPVPSGNPKLGVIEGKRHALVLYVFSNNDELYYENLKFFIDTSVRPWQLMDYVFIINQNSPAPGDTSYDIRTQPWRAGYLNINTLPTLPPNAQYVEHTNECFDTGTVSWFLDTVDYAKSWRSHNKTSPPRMNVPAHWDPDIYGHLDFDFNNYQYFVMANPSVRGPILPSWWDYENRDVYWFAPFYWMQEAVPSIKLTGPLFSCSRDSPHVQSFLLVFGIEVFLAMRHSSGFRCARNNAAAVFYGELAISSQVLDAGWNINSVWLPVAYNEIRSNHELALRGQHLEISEIFHCKPRMKPGIWIPLRIYDTLEPHDAINQVFVKNQISRARLPFTSSLCEGSIRQMLAQLVLAEYSREITPA